MLLLVAMFAALTFLVPTSWVKKLNALIEPKTITKGVYSGEVATLDQALKAGEVVDVKALKARRAEIQLRRLAQAGPMTGDDVRRVLKQLMQDNKQLDREPNAASRAAMREELSLRLAKTLPRFDVKVLVKTLDTFDEQYTKSISTP